MHFFLVSLVTFSSVLYGSEAVRWTPRDPRTSVAFAKVLEPGIALISADCTLNVHRPIEGDLENTTMHPDSNGLCQVVTTQGDHTRLNLDLSREPIFNWGNRFFPKGFSIRGDTARDLWLRMEKVYESGESQIHQDFTGVGTTTLYEWDSYKLLSEDGLAVLTCSREYWYNKGETRPSSPSDERCDFIYQFSISGN